MRLRIFGIPKILLVFLGLLPTAIWCLFHPSLLSFHERAFVTALTAGLVFAAIFTYFFIRGFFGVRFGVLLFSLAVVADAFINAMMERDFSKLGLALLVFGIGMATSFWLERRVGAADLNPNLHWFEGEPKLMTQIAAKLKFEDLWQEGQIRAIDRNGFFIFLDTLAKPPKARRFPFELKFKDLSFAGEGQINAHYSGARSGFGLQFYPKDLYHFSQYTALVERLKGEGL